MKCIEMMLIAKKKCLPKYRIFCSLFMSQRKSDKNAIKRRDHDTVLRVTIEICDQWSIDNGLSAKYTRHAYAKNTILAA